MYLVDACILLIPMFHIEILILCFDCLKTLSENGQLIGLSWQQLRNPRWQLAFDVVSSLTIVLDPAALQLWMRSCQRSALFSTSMSSQTQSSCLLIVTSTSHNTSTLPRYVMTWAHGVRSRHRNCTTLSNIITSRNTISHWPCSIKYVIFMILLFISTWTTPIFQWHIITTNNVLVDLNAIVFLFPCSDYSSPIF